MCKSLKKAPRPSAGLLILRDERILILKRAKRSRNGGTWGLPGGRLDEYESLYGCAHRESVEEMQSVPKHGVIGQITVNRTRRPYAIFACRSRKKHLRNWKPALNHEHVDWRWVDFAWVRSHRHKLHPVLQNLISEKAGRKWLRKVLKTSRHDRKFAQVITIHRRKNGGL